MYFSECVCIAYMQKKSVLIVVLGVFCTSELIFISLMCLILFFFLITDAALLLLLSWPCHLLEVDKVTLCASFISLSVNFKH